MSKEFFLYNCEFFNDWDESEMIEELSSVNSHISVAIAMNFFGISQLEAGISLHIYDDQIGRVIEIFDKYLSVYTFSVGVHENIRVFQKV